MASTKGEPDNWSTRARRPAAEDPASHLDSTGALLDPVHSTFPAPTRDDQRPGPAPSDETQALAPDRPERPSRGMNDDDSIYAPPRRRTPPPTRQRPRRVKQVRRVRRTLRHIDPLSVLKVSLMFYGCFLVIWLVFVAVLYWIVQAAGLFESVDSIREALALEGSWTLSLSLVEKWAFFIGLTLSIVMSLVNLFLAFLYNVVADVIGGIDMTFVERD